MSRSPRQVLFLSLLLFLTTFALYSPSLSFGLLSFDDPVFITHNPIIYNGVSWSAFRSAFTGLHGDETMYVPLLWVSFLLDDLFFGASATNPWGYHFTNVLLHALNAVLFFLILLFCCKKPWRALFFAAIWALHPQRVESVAWVTERKDVLSGLFTLLCISAYLRTWRRTATGAVHMSLPTYGAAFAFFILGLLVKPMLVTLPFLFLLLDVWPLRRVQPDIAAAWRAAPRLLLEKTPFFLGAFLASVIVYMTQTHAISSAPLSARLYHIPWNYWFYLRTFFWPVGLHAMVPRIPVSIPSVLLAIGILGAVSHWVWVRRHRHPNEMVGWLAFLGLLFPVVGIVLIGVYPVADRYSYLPSMGLILSLVFFLPSALFAKYRFLSRIERLLPTIGLLALLALLTSRLLPSWRNDSMFYAHIERHSPGHYAVIHYRARVQIFTHGDFESANAKVDELLELRPRSSFGLVLKALCLSQLQSTEAALEFALAHYPPHDVYTNPGVYENHLAILALFARQYDQANHYMQETFQRSINEPKTQEQLHSLAMLLAREQDDEQTALVHASHIAALRQRETLAPEDYFLSYAMLWSQGFYAQTLPYFLELAETRPERPDVLNNIAWLLATTAGSPADPTVVVDMARQALQGAPGHPLIGNTLSVALANAGDFESALLLAHGVAQALERSTDPSAPRILQGVENRIDLFQEGLPYREQAHWRILYAP